MTSKYHQQWQTIANFKYDSSYSNSDILHCLTCCEVDGGCSEIVGNSLPWGSSVSGAASVAWVPSPGMRLVSVLLLIVWKKTWSINIMFIITWTYLLWIFFKRIRDDDTWGLWNSFSTDVRIKGTGRLMTFIRSLRSEVLWQHLNVFSDAGSFFSFKVAGYEGEGGVNLCRRLSLTVPLLCFHLDCLYPPLLLRHHCHVIVNEGCLEDVNLAFSLAFILSGKRTVRTRKPVLLGFFL